MLNWRSIGHLETKRVLDRDLSTQTYAHAYLLSGPAQIGKFALAKEFARALLCPEGLCYTCAECRQIDNLTHPDLLVIDQLYIDKINADWTQISKFSNFNQNHRKDNPPAKTNTIGIEDVQVIQEWVAEKPLGERKICLIRDIERFTREASNALLKTIEEPPTNTFFICTSSRESLVLETILSRLRVLRLNLLSGNLIAPLLKNSDLKAEILQYAQGRLELALELDKDREKFLEYRTQYQEIVDFYENRSLVQKTLFLEKKYEDNEALEWFLEYSLLYWRSLNDGNSKLNTSILELLVKAHQQILNTNINRKMLLENMLFHIEMALSTK
ncbi:MAG TPA: hypothetical protein PLQ36_02610 [Candidatus Gracilibacteria bacterium]|nr:hypothetical protein [Candidatus Gracilibacteria bacterium]